MPFLSTRRQRSLCEQTMVSMMGSDLVLLYFLLTIARSSLHRELISLYFGLHYSTLPVAIKDVKVHPVRWHSFYFPILYKLYIHHQWPHLNHVVCILEAGRRLTFQPRLMGQTAGDNKRQRTGWPKGESRRQEMHT